MNRNIIIPSNQLSRAGLEQLPATIVRAGEKASWRFLEFFTANIRNRNTRAAYARAVVQFFRWCEQRQISLEQIHPSLIGAYIESHAGDAPTVKQHLSITGFRLSAILDVLSIRNRRPRTKRKNSGLPSRRARILRLTRSRKPMRHSSPTLVLG